MGSLRLSDSGSVRVEGECTVHEILFSMECGHASGPDALAHAWPHQLLYAFPLLAMIPPTLSRVREYEGVLYDCKLRVFEECFLDTSLSSARCE